MILVGAEFCVLCSGCAVGCSARIFAISADVIAGVGTLISRLMALERSQLSKSLDTLSATYCVCFASVFGCVGVGGF